MCTIKKIAIQILALVKKKEKTFVYATRPQLINRCKKLGEDVHICKYLGKCVCRYKSLLGVCFTVSRFLSQMPKILQKIRGASHELE